MNKVHRCQVCGKKRLNRRGYCDDCKAFLAVCRAVQHPADRGPRDLFNINYRVSMYALDVEAGRKIQYIPRDE